MSTPSIPRSVSLPQLPIAEATAGPSAPTLVRSHSMNDIDARTDRTGRSVLQTIGKVLTFPARYVGSKTWSLPGVVVRLPILFWKLITGQLNRNDPAFQEAMHQATSEEIRPYLRYASACAAVHSMQDERYLSGYEDDLRFHNVEGYNVDRSSLPGNVELHEGRIFFDEESGFKAAVVEAEGQVMITFGALDSLSHVLYERSGAAAIDRQINEMGEEESVEKEGLRLERERCLVRYNVAERRKAARKNQYGAIAKNVLGGVPTAWEQADALVRQLKNDPAFAGKEIVLVGQCFGGSLATYAALQNGLKARAFNTLPMGAGLQYQIGSEKMQRATELVTHVSAETDFVSDNRYLGPVDWVIRHLLPLRTPGNPGKRLSVPSAYDKRDETHDYIHGSLMQHGMGAERADNVDGYEIDVTRFVARDFVAHFPEAGEAAAAA